MSATNVKPTYANVAAAPPRPRLTFADIAKAGSRATQTIIPSDGPVQEPVPLLPSPVMTEAQMNSPSVDHSGLATSRESPLAADVRSDTSDPFFDPGLDKDDSMYDARSSANRVDAPSAYTSIIQTRRAKAAAQANGPHETEDDPPLTMKPTTPSKKRVRRTQVVPTSDSDRDTEEERPVSKKPKRSKATSAKRRQQKKGKGRARSPPPQHLDEEAEEGGDEEEVYDPYPDHDGYDSTDSFIDDSAPPLEESDASRTVDPRRPGVLTQVPPEPRVSKGQAAPSPRVPSSSKLAPPTPLTPSNTLTLSQAPATPLGVVAPPTSAGATPHTPGRAGSQQPRPFGSMMATPKTPSAAPTTPTASVPSPTLQDSEFREARPLPDKCQVSDRSLQDQLLYRFYNGLAALWQGVFEGWNSLHGSGMVLFSGWGKSCPAMSFDACLNAIELRTCGDCINPSRISPRSVLIRTMPGIVPRFHLYGRNRRPAICVSTIYCTESYVTAPSPRGLQQKFISGIFHSQEWERFVGFMCTSFGYDVLHAQLSRDAIQFSTRIKYNRNNDTSSTGSSMFSNVRSPSVSNASSSIRAPTSDNFSLDCDDIVPVYDCRNVDVDFTQDLLSMDFPSFEGEIPKGSFVVVGYTASVYRAQSGKWTITLNLKWAIVLAPGRKLISVIFVRV
ncbi:hypothetical protein MD484_g5619, partial [Candolleomyces efflorescens]